MRRLSVEEIEKISNEWLKSQNCPVDERDAFHDRLGGISCTIAFPLGEIMNPKLEGYMWVLALKGMPKPRPITDIHNFGTQGLEGCIEVEHQDLTLALLLWQEATNPHRINIFVKGKLKMSDFIANVISVTKVRAELQQLLATYTAEKAENQELQDEHGIEYWDSACQTIHEVAAALRISLEVGQDEQADDVDYRSRTYKPKTPEVADGQHNQS